MKSAIFICLLLLSSSALGAEGKSIPSRYLGHWSGNADSCSSETDDLKLEIDNEKVTYWESQGTVKAAVVGRRGELAVILEMKGEGETWLSTAILEISSDGKRLTDSSNELVRYKCPQK